MATLTSSLLGANLNADDTTALFALGTVAQASGDQVLEYVCCSGTFTTGYIVTITPSGTAFALISASITANAKGYDIGFVQNTISASQFGWVAKSGRNLYVRCSGTCTAGSAVGVGFATTGTLVSQPACALSMTALGIYITTTATTAEASVGVATVTWPRSIVQDA